jgi:hypothetical protein
MIKLNGNTIHLMGKEVSYVMVINEKGDLINFHIGKKIADSQAYYQNSCRDISKYPKKSFHRSIMRFDNLLL